MENLKDSLEDMVKEGVLLYVDDRLASPNEIIKKQCVHEDSNYMVDFVFNDDGSYKEMRFDKVVNK